MCQNYCQLSNFAHGKKLEANPTVFQYFAIVIQEHWTIISVSLHISHDALITEHTSVHNTGIEGRI